MQHHCILKNNYSIFATLLHKDKIQLPSDDYIHKCIKLPFDATIGAGR